jgi:hypothetical protein
MMTSRNAHRCLPLAIPLASLSSGRCLLNRAAFGSSLPTTVLVMGVFL